jgi:DNA-binding HxlR family transcriptional regulator
MGFARLSPSQLVQDSSTNQLTPLGVSMLKPMNAACAWAREHWDELIDAREAGLGLPAETSL